ncbi:hypothetical protein HUT06_06725 [Actinomadura sp. NAK00032]|uniref:hypothetical protein n=1 Tax=Actinomadura sp. NAK00032 TaxID=2742128 RepID=UPI0015915478|nr:hypothetical protein [Actinomadura sp. NAK00032]QKW33764.1 hypothetical protein HUT06_06725 [Actinomadura sp. NAK00032]
MDLRPELLPPTAAPERLAELASEIERIADLLARGEPAAAAIDEFNQATGHAYTTHDFTDHLDRRTLDEFALEAARPAHPRVADITRAELAEIVRRIQAADPETDYYSRVLDASVSSPDWAALIFHTPALDDPDQIADEILAHRPIAL